MELYSVSCNKTYNRKEFEGMNFFLTFIFIHLAAQSLSCGMWDLVP